MSMPHTVGADQVHTERDEAEKQQEAGCVPGRSNRHRFGLNL